MTSRENSTLQGGSRRRRTAQNHAALGRTITPGAAALQNVHDAADDAAVKQGHAHMTKNGTVASVGPNSRTPPH
jgi:hypothetical protein